MAQTLHLSRAAPHFLLRKEEAVGSGPDVASGSSLIPAHPVSQKLILCIDDIAAILSYEEAPLEGSGYSTAFRELTVESRRSWNGTRGTGARDRANTPLSLQRVSPDDFSRAPASR